MTSVQVITVDEFRTLFRGKFGNNKEYYDEYDFVNIQKLKENLGDLVPAGKRIGAVVAASSRSSRYKNKINPLVPLKKATPIDQSCKGSYSFYLPPTSQSYTFLHYVTDFVVGDVFVVIH